MPKLKPHLKELYRTPLIENTRYGSLRLDMNESASGLPESFVQKVLSEIDADFLATYPEYLRLQRKIAKYNHLLPENICLANGSDAGIKYLFDAYINPGDKVLLTDPTFAMYPVYCKMFNAVSVSVKYKSDFQFPYAEFIETISSKIKMAAVVNPNNPTGSVIESNKLLEIIKKANKYDVLLVVDEAYFYFCPDTVISKVRDFRNLVVLRTFSKLCGMASLRLGYIAASSEIIENIRKVKPTYDINALAALFAEKLLDNPKIIDGLIRQTNEGKQYLAKKLSTENIEYKEGRANFILIKCNRRVDEIMAKLTQKNILVSGKFKTPFLTDYIRVTVGNKKCMERFWKHFMRIWERAKQN